MAEHGQCFMAYLVRAAGSFPACRDFQASPMTRKPCAVYSRSLLSKFDGTVQKRKRQFITAFNCFLIKGSLGAGKVYVPEDLESTNRPSISKKGAELNFVQ